MRCIVTNMAVNAQQRKQPQVIENSTPRFLADQGIGSNEWQVESKSRLRRMAVSETWPDKARVWASLSLHSFGFSSPVAIRLHRGRPVLLTRGDIAEETGISGPRVRTALAVLESEGWIERASVSGKAGLERGDIEIRVFALFRESGSAIKTAASVPPCGFVYFFETMDGQYIKIGHSTSPTKRLHGLQTLRPKIFELHPLGWLPGTRNDEARFHRQFAADRVEGEYFKKTERLMNFIQSLPLLHPETIKAA